MLEVPGGWSFKRMRIVELQRCLISHNSYNLIQLINMQALPIDFTPQALCMWACMMSRAITPKGKTNRLSIVELGFSGSNV